MYRWLFAGSLMLALASVSHTQTRAPSDDGLSPAEILSAALTTKSDAKTDAAPGNKSNVDAKKAEGAKAKRAKKSAAAAPPKPDAKAEAAKRAQKNLKQCLSNWDAATHITRARWAQVCREIVIEEPAN